MNIFKKLALLTIFAGLTIGYTTPIFSAASSSSSSSSSRATTPSTVCHIDQAILDDPKKIETCLEIWHLRKLIIDAVINEAHALKYHLDKKWIKIDSGLDISSLLDRQNIKKFEDKSIELFQQEQIIYSEASKEVQAFIDTQEDIAVSKLPTVEEIRLKKIEPGARFPTYKNISHFLKAKIFTKQELFKKKEIFNDQLLNLKLQQKDWPTLHLAGVNYNVYIASQYRALSRHNQIKTSLPPSILPLCMKSLSKVTLDVIVNLLHQKYILGVVDILEPLITQKISFLKSDNSVSARLQKKQLDLLLSKIKKIKGDFSHESIRHSAAQIFAENFFLDNLIELFDNALSEEIERHHYFLPLNNKQPHRLEDCLEPSLYAIKEIMKNPGKFEELLKLSKLQGLVINPAPTPILDISNEKTNQKSKKKKKKSKAKHSQQSQEFVDHFSTLSLQEISSSSSSRNLSSLETEEDTQLTPVTFEGTNTTEPAQDNDWQFVEEEIETDQEDTNDVEDTQPVEDTQFINTQKMIGLLDIKRTHYAGNENSIFIYKMYKKQKKNPLLGKKLDARTYKKSANPYDNNHAFTKLVENYGSYAHLDKCEKMLSGQCKCFYSIPGRIATMGYPAERAEEMGPNGHFEFIIVKDHPQQQGGRCIHRFFRPGQTAFPGLLTEEALA
ncbi:hypothetical protein IPF37_00090 [bacterium]|nr:MAG: hypothetical protein IPF37_00090 [bacterium]